MNSEENMMNNNDNDDEFFQFTHDFINLDTLHLTFSIIRNKWADSDNQNAADISLLIRINQACRVSETNFLFDEIFILSRNFLISETKLDFHKILFEIL